MEGKSRRLRDVPIDLTSTHNSLQLQFSGYIDDQYSYLGGPRMLFGPRPRVRAGGGGKTSLNESRLIWLVCLLQ